MTPLPPPPKLPRGSSRIRQTELLFAVGMALVFILAHFWFGFLR